jgi:Mg-chelatase subunit ChlD
MQPEQSWAKKRQTIVIIGFLVLAVLILSIVGYVFFYDAPTCMDNRKNQNETGIDCGGLCARICEDDAERLTIDWVRLFKIREGVYSAVARLENPAPNSIAKDVPYTFSLKDRGGRVVATRSGSVFIPSRDTFVVFEGTIISDDDPESVTFAFDEEPAWERSDYIEPDIVVVDKQLTDLETTPRLVATLQNPHLVDIKNITLDALIYDDQGNAVQVSETYIERIGAGATTKATFTWPNPISLKSRICESPVDAALVIDRSGSMEYLGLNPPQPLTDVKTAAKSFINELSKFDQATIVSFANEGSNPVDAFLSSELSVIKQAIENIAIIPPSNTQNTNIGDGMLQAAAELESERHRAASGKIMVVLTDGVATRPLKAGDTTYPEKFALGVAQDAKQKGIRVFTIGLGKDLNQSFLSTLASTSTDFYLAPTAADLQGIYHEIGTKMCKRQPTALEIVPSIPL